ncbi:MAG TPA: acyl-CoA dehydrogenase family protein [Dehalococcoidia bacterium]|nr:acyl-CoA dehydrogenase family protein [Dehalococcoidia bacterium]
MTAEKTRKTTRTPGYPKDREALRLVLLDAVESVREAAEAGADEMERIGRLPESVVAALDASGLFGMKLPAELGGAEADPVTQIEVIEKMAGIEPSVGWCMFIGATSIGWPGAFLPDESIPRVFDSGHVPHVAGVGGVRGRGVEVEGGYKISGRFQFASGIGHAEWLVGGAAIQDEAGETVEQRFFLIPVSEAVNHDNWQVAGLKGTSSGDFSTDGLFVPREMTWDWQDLAQGNPQRGGPLFHLGMPAFTSNEHAAFSLGVGRKCLDLVIEMAQSKRRGHGAAATLVRDRPVFQRFVGEADLRLRAARALVVELQERAWQEVCAGRHIEPSLATELRSAGVLATEVAVDVATQSMRYAGGGALFLTNKLQRCFRDVVASGQHLAVSDTAYEAHAQFLLGLGENVPMTGTR